MVDLRQTPQYARYMKSLGWQVAKCRVAKPNPQMFLKKVPLVGVIVKLQRPEGKINFNEIKHLINKYNIAAYYIEPTENLHHPESFKNSKSTFLPAKTIHIDLTKSEEQLLKEMKPKTRYNIKIAKKRGVVANRSTDIAAFRELWKSSARRRLALPQSKEIDALWNAFKSKAYLLLAYSNKVHVHGSTAKEPLAGVLICSSADTGFYMYAGSTSEGKKLFAPTLVAWEAIKSAKKLKLKTFDFEGIYDERYSSTKSWKGFTKFKEGFGGKVIEFPKTLVFHKNVLLKLFNF